MSFGQEILLLFNCLKCHQISSHCNLRGNFANKLKSFKMHYNVTIWGLCWPCFSEVASLDFRFKSSIYLEEASTQTQSDTQLLAICMPSHVLSQINSETIPFLWFSHIVPTLPFLQPSVSFTRYSVTVKNTNKDGITHWNKYKLLPWNSRSYPGANITPQHLHWLFKIHHQANWFDYSELFHSVAQPLSLYTRFTLLISACLFLNILLAIILQSATWTHEKQMLVLLPRSPACRSLAPLP